MEERESSQAKQTILSIVQMSARKGLGVFHRELDNRGISWYQNHASHQIKGYSFGVSFDGHSTTWFSGSELSREMLSWPRLKTELVGHKNPGSPRAQTGSDLLSFLYRATNGEGDVALNLLTQRAALTDDQLAAVQDSYSVTHARSRWETIWSLAWLMIGVDPAAVDRPDPAYAPLIAALLAAQARPFCVPDTAWDLDAYDTLTRPWRTVLGPIYPDDPELPASVNQDPDDESNTTE